MNIPKEVVIVGGGASLQEGIHLGLKDKLQNKFVITCNFSFNHFPNTFTTFVDPGFYSGQLKEPQIGINKEHLDSISKLPLLIGQNISQISSILRQNTLLLPCNNTYQGKNSPYKGFYCPILVGIFSISLAQYLMDYNGTIFLLGFDYGAKNGVTHYYSKSEIDHRGQGKVNYYDNNDPHHFFKWFIEPNIKIFNVSPTSNIVNFEKIDYHTFFNQLFDIKYNQEELRNSIKSKILSEVKNVYCLH